MDAYPQLRQSPQFSRHPTQRMLLNLARGRLEWNGADDSDGATGNGSSNKKKKILLPSTETLLKAFRMRHWATTKQSLIPIATCYDDDNIVNHHYADESNQSPIPSDIAMETILDTATGGSGGRIQDCGPFNTVCEEANIYQLWTQEYVQQLGNYLMQRASEYNTNTDNINNTDNEEHFPTTLVLDIGAGDGLLLHYLQEYYNTTCQRQSHQESSSTTSTRGRMQQRIPANSTSTYIPSMEYIATDDGSWKIFPKAQVETLNVQQALEKYCNEHGHRPVIVLCSWMPMGQDWTQDFRKANVKEYILIGEADDGSCGHNWKTWGNIDYKNDTTTSTKEEYGNDDVYNFQPPPYQQDGYQRWDTIMNDGMDLARYQFSRFDCALSKSGKTVSFRQNKSNEH